MSDNKVKVPTEATGSRGASIWKRWIIGLVIVFALLVIGVLLAWINRAPLAERYIAGWCVDQNLDCAAEFSELNFDYVRVENISLGSKGETIFTVDDVIVELDWLGFLEPEVKKINARAPVINAVLDENGVSLPGLDGLLSGDASDTRSSDAPMDIPVLEITEGRLLLATDAGDLSGGFALIGKPLEYGTAQINIDPASLQKGEDILRLSKGVVDLEFRKNIVIGSVDVALDEAVISSMIVKDADFAVALVEQDSQFVMELSGQIKDFQSDELTAQNVDISSQVGLIAPEEQSLEAMLAALGKVVIHIGGENNRYADMSLADAELNSELARSLRGGLDGPIAIEATDIVSADGTVGSLGVSGDIYADPRDRGSYEFMGDIVTSKVSLSSKLRGELLSSFELPEPFDAHAGQLRRAFWNGLSGFDVGFSVESSLAGDDWSVLVQRATTLQTASGLRISIDPSPDDRWLKLAPNIIDLAGRVSLSGGGAPGLDTFVDVSLGQSDNAYVRLNNFNMAPWTANGATLEAAINSLNLSRTPAFSIDMKGELIVSGAVSGLEMMPTRLIGQVTAAQGREGWRIQTHNNSCIGFDTLGIEAGTLIVAATTLSLCPVDGRFVRQEDDKSVGHIDLGDLNIPFRSADSSGAFGMDNASVEWFSGDGVRLFVNGDTFSVPMQFSEDNLTIDGANPLVEIALDDGPPTMKASLGRTVFGGTMVPAKVLSDTFVFDAALTSAGIAGTMSASRVHIEDLNEGPIYQPLIAELSATLIDGVIHMTGPIRTRAQGIQIADSKLDLNLAELNGTAHVELLPLSFAKGGFQPLHLSELLRGVLINASGGVVGGADFQIREGELSGQGYVDFIDLIFDTFTAGTVSGVNGRLAFSDILELTTPPGQEIAIGFMNPGVPLFDGKVNLQIIGGTLTKIEGIIWPFAGGELAVLPATFDAEKSIDDVDTIVVEARGWEMERLIEVFRVPDLHATGTISGRFPIDIDGANIMIRDAVLEADENGGKLAYTGDVVDVVKGQNQYADYAFDALKDLDYSVMRVGANGNLIGKIIVTADLLGKSKDVLGGAEFKFGLSVDSHLSQLLHSASNASRETYVSEAIKLRDEAIAEGGE